MLIDGKMPRQHPRFIAGEYHLTAFRPQVWHFDFQHLLAVDTAERPRCVGCRHGQEMQFNESHLRDIRVSQSRVKFSGTILWGPTSAALGGASLSAELGGTPNAWATNSVTRAK
jgi:hypothetical protein